MKIIKFLQESFETKERFQQEISFKLNSDNQISFLLQTTKL